MSLSLLGEALAESGGTTAISFADADPGDSFEGKIISTDFRQTTVFGTNDPDTWEDGNPKMQALITIQTDLVDDEIEDDDGSRTVYVKWWGNQRQALIAAVKASGDDDVHVGGYFKVTYKGEGKRTRKGYNPPKLYEYEYTPPKSGIGKAVEADVDEDEDVSLEEQIEGMIQLKWTDSKIRKALPGASAAMIAAVRKSLD